MRPSPPLRQRVLSFIGDDQYNLAERAIHSLDTTELAADSVQDLLTARLSEGSYAIKKLIIGKLAHAPGLHSRTVTGLVSVLNGTNPELTGNVLDLFALHRIGNIDVARHAASLLAKQNGFVARKAYNYLHGLPIQDPYVERQIKIYENKQVKE
ncbi:hypothetical protein [Dyadobacter sp. 676]|uniref:HEAT repeat domain-containing protein n=1 Tax=Dyadobacter sp. 676 TaxID=3088362 RepID=A0AAU8FJI1_9BACT